MKHAIFFIVVLSCFPCLKAQDKSGEAPAEAKPKKDQSLYTKKYTVPATFFRWLKQGPRTPTSDPFADPAQKSEWKPVTPAEKLASLGIITGTDGISAVFNPAIAAIVLRGTEKHHEILTAALETFSSSSERQIHIIVEFIEVEHLDFSDWLLDNKMSGDGTELRKVVQEWVRDKEGTILETSMISARSGQRAKTESGDEYIYPTEISPPNLPSTLTLSDRAEMPIVGPHPSAFETRNLGVTLEVDPVLGADNTTIDLSLAPEIVKLSGHTEWFSEETQDELKIRMPIFHRMKVSTQVTLLDGRYVLAGSCRPMPEEKSKRDDAIVLLFIRADVGHLAKWSVEEVPAE